MSALQRFQQLLLRRTTQSTANQEDLLIATDENGNNLTRLYWNGKLQVTSGVDVNQSSGAAEFAVLGGDSSTKFQIWNAGGGQYMFKADQQGFQIFGANVTNGSNTCQPVRLRGWKSTSGAPTDGTWSTNDAIWDGASPRRFWICTSGGTPGTWS